MEKINQPHIPSAGLHLLRQWPQFFVGIDRILGFYSISPSGQMDGVEIIKSGSGYREIDLELDETMRAALDSSRKERIAFQWLRPDLLPFVSRSGIQSRQLDLFSESKYLVLLIRTASLVPEYSDLFYLFFREDQSNFGVINEQTPFDTTQKAIIGRLATQFAQLTMQSFQQSESRLQWFKEQTHQIISNNQEQKVNVSSNFDHWRKDWLIDYIRESSRRDSVNYVLSEEAEKQILEFNGSFSQLKKSLQDCMVYICELQSAGIGDDVYIDSSFLILPTNTIDQPHERPHSDESTSRLSKTAHLLDRLEKAALQLVQRGLQPTSAEVGSHMDKPITAPAISDALRKNKARVIQLFEKYPDNWPTIRHHFKPISNLLTKKNDELRATN